MSIQALIEQIARTAMVVDTADPEAVQALREQFEQLQEHCPSDPESALRKFTEDAVRLLSQVTDEAGAEDFSSFDELLSQISDIQGILNQASRPGGNGAEELTSAEPTQTNEPEATILPQYRLSG